MRIGWLGVLLCGVTLAAPTRAPAQPRDDWSVTRDPFDKTTIARYKALLDRSPHDERALAALTRLYRNYRTLSQLETEYAKQTSSAALVVRARIRLAERDAKAARPLLEAAAQQRPADGETWLLLGQLLAESGAAEAPAALERAAQTGRPPTAQKALNELTQWAAARGDLALAESIFAKRAAMTPNDAELHIEWADTLARANRWAEAEVALRQANRLTHKHPVRSAEISARLGIALEGQSRLDDAAKAYAEGLAHVPRDHAVARDLVTRWVDVERRSQRLDALATEFEARFPLRGRTHFEWNTLGMLYEETGQSEKAVVAYRAAVGKAPWEIATQRRLIALLDATGQPVAARAQLEAIARAMPGDAQLQLELAERYLRDGLRAKALATWQRIGTSFSKDPTVQSTLADAYARAGEEARARATFERLAKLPSDDPMHLISLGEYYWSSGDPKTAMQMWQRLAQGPTPSIDAQMRLADVLADHKLLAEARGQWNQLLTAAPKDVHVRRRYAGFLESLRDLSGALAEYERAHALAPISDRALRRELRGSIVAIVVRLSHVRAVKTWLRAFEQGDVEAGLFLADYYAQQRNVAELVAVYARLYQLAPTRDEIIDGYVGAQRSAGNWAIAIEALTAAATAAPQTARARYAEIAELKSLARDDEGAIEWSQRAISQAPNDATLHVRLAERLVESQRFDEARLAFARAAELRPTDWTTWLALAQLHAQRGDLPQAFAHYRRVIEGTTDPGPLEAAGRAALAIAESTDTLGQLEATLLPLVRNGSPQPLYRALLLDVYAQFVPRLARDGNSEQRRALGGRALALLLEALHDPEGQPQRVTIDLLEQLGHPGAAPALVAFAKTTLDQPPSVDSGPRRELAVAALIAAGNVGGSAATPSLLTLASADHWALAEAATFVISAGGAPNSVAWLANQLRHPRPTMRALACLGLANTPQQEAALLAVLRDDETDLVRGACAYALGRRRATSARPALRDLVASSQGQSQRLGAWALGQMPDAASWPTLLRAYLHSTTDDRSTLEWAMGRVLGVGRPAATVALYSDGVSVANLVARLPGPLPRLTATAAGPWAAAARPVLPSHLATCDVVLLGPIELVLGAGPKRCRQLPEP